jgi:PDZ domain-containing secreted protein
MAMDGTVGSVGGTGQKAAAAHNNDMDAFLVPAAGADYENAEAHSRDVEVIPVDTLDEALQVLEDLGGDPLELPLDDVP